MTMKLEEITVGASVEGVNERGPIKVKSLEWFGDQALKIIFDGLEGGVQERILYRDDEIGLKIAHTISRNGDDFSESTIAGYGEDC